MRSQLLRRDARRACHEHRERADALPAHVVAPLTLAGVAVGGAGLTAHWLGLSLPGVLAVTLVVSALTAVAVHRTISSLAVGAGVLLAQPYRPGDQVRVHLPTLHRTVDAEVMRVGAANTTLLVRDSDAARNGMVSLVVVPNNRMLRSPGD